MTISVRMDRGGDIRVFPFDQKSLESMVNLMHKSTETPRTEMGLSDGRALEIL